MKKLIGLLSLLVALIFLGACSAGQTKDTAASSSDKKVVKYGKAAGPYTVLFEDAIIPILEKQGYTFEVVEFSDLLQNDTALNEGEVDVNVEQHTAYMENFNKTQNGNLVAITKIPTIPAGIFSAKHKNLNEIANGAKIAIPSDASNTARAYKLLEKAGWIKLNASADVSKLTKDDIIENPYSLEITEMDSANIPRSLDDFDYAVITGSIVYSAGIDASSTLLQETILDHLILQAVVKEENKDTEWAKAIKEAYHSKEFKEYLDKNNNGLWFVPND
ncbi:Methionine ABC transporter substrate-binding protein [Streptococcus oralis]|uniref:Methionine ABC transporter substrate-binding protein n=1 Tax=Streptococcus oralis TaxID=1303 RepID=A0A139RP75_STROR|nr:MetQ/NlpA family ABC transporter substrate-binding protein [Streptococcus oralis]KXU16567.1 Methionine ABC transporter substrate-binding protein [Streptococcus oralis]